MGPGPDVRSHLGLVTAKPGTLSDWIFNTKFKHDQHKVYFKPRKMSYSIDTAFILEQNRPAMPLYQHLKSPYIS